MRSGPDSFNDSLESPVRKAPLPKPAPAESKRGGEKETGAISGPNVAGADENKQYPNGRENGKREEQHRS